MSMRLGQSELSVLVGTNAGDAEAGNDGVPSVASRTGLDKDLGK